MGQRRLDVVLVREVAGDDDVRLDGARRITGHGDLQRDVDRATVGVDDFGIARPRRAAGRECLEVDEVHHLGRVHRRDRTPPRQEQPRRLVSVDDLAVRGVDRDKVGRRFHHARATSSGRMLAGTTLRRDSCSARIGARLSSDRGDAHAHDQPADSRMVEAVGHGGVHVPGTVERPGLAHHDTDGTRCMQERCQLVGDAIAIGRHDQIETGSAIDDRSVADGEQPARALIGEAHGEVGVDHEHSLGKTVERLHRHAFERALGVSHVPFARVVGYRSRPPRRFHHSLCPPTCPSGSAPDTSAVVALPIGRAGRTPWNRGRS